MEYWGNAKHFFGNLAQPRLSQQIVLLCLLDLYIFTTNTLCSELGDQLYYLPPGILRHHKMDQINSLQIWLIDVWFGRLSAVFVFRAAVNEPKERAHKADISWRCGVSASCWPSPRSSPSSSPSSSSPPTPTVTSSCSGWTWARPTWVCCGCSRHTVLAPIHFLSNSSASELPLAPYGRFA